MEIIHFDESSFILFPCYDEFTPGDNPKKPSVPII